MLLGALTSFAQAADGSATAGATFGRKVENTFRNWKLEELPPVVQKTVKAQSVGHRITDIDREDRTGRTIWEVRLDGVERGAKRVMHIDNDGALLNGAGERVSTPPSGGNAGRAQKGVYPAPGDTKGQPEKVKRKWKDVPEAVKRAAAKYGTKDYVKDIDMEVRDGIQVWELEFSREGQNIELHFADDGRVLEHIDSGKKAPQQLK